jgi:hypothetical protein
MTLKENFDTDEICCRKAANLCISGEQPPLLKNRNKTTVDFKTLKSVGVL